MRKSCLVTRSHSSVASVVPWGAASPGGCRLGVVGVIRQCHGGIPCSLVGQRQWRCQDLLVLGVDILKGRRWSRRGHIDLEVEGVNLPLLDRGPDIHDDHRHGAPLKDPVSGSPPQSQSAHHLEGPTELLAHGPKGPANPGVHAQLQCPGQQQGPGDEIETFDIINFQPSHRLAPQAGVLQVYPSHRHPINTLRAG